MTLRHILSANSTLFLYHRMNSTMPSTSNTASSPSQSSSVKFRAVQVGTPGTSSFRIYFVKEGDGASTSTMVSPFHDIPLHTFANSGILNMIVEVPRHSHAKLEISKQDSFNPIKQDVKKGKLRFIHNCFPHHGYPWNYGALSQTWESPDHLDKHTGMRGDNDPLDVLDIGTRRHEPGSIIQVKVLGALGMIDEGETDWKILVIDTQDPLAEKINDLPDIEAQCPGLLDATRHWFTVYKVPEGKSKNNFAFDGEAQGRDFALGIISECHEAWKKLTQQHGGEALAAKHGISLINAVTKADQPLPVEEKSHEPASYPSTDIHYIK